MLNVKSPSDASATGLNLSLWPLFSVTVRCHIVLMSDVMFV